MNEENPNLKAFLEGLAELSIKHNLTIGGCGCCGSPWITEREVEAGSYTEMHLDNLTFVEKDDD